MREYDTVTWNGENWVNSKTNKSLGNQILTVVGELGKEGWQLVSATSLNEKYLLVFMRESRRVMAYAHAVWNGSYWLSRDGSRNYGADLNGVLVAFARSGWKLAAVVHFKKQDPYLYFVK